MIEQETIAAIKTKFNALKVELDERSRRLWAATEACALGHGGVSAVSRATGIAESTIRIGKREMSEKASNVDERRVRKKGGGRKSLTHTDSDILTELDALVEPSSRGDPISPLRWTCKSTRKLSEELKAQGHSVSHAQVGKLLSDLNYSLQGTQKRMEGKAHPDRDAQFRFINSKVIEFQKYGHPVISVDTKKKELIGRFFNSGREYQPQGKPAKVFLMVFMI